MSPGLRGSRYPEMQYHNRYMSKPRSLIISVVVLALVLTGVPSGAQSSKTRAEREKVRQAKAQEARDLQPLVAEDRELEEAVAVMAAEVAAQEAKVESARQAVEAAEAEIASLQQKIKDLRAEREVLVAEARERAIAAYVGREDDRFEEFVRSENINEASHKQELLTTVQGSEADAKERLRSVEEDLELAEVEAQDLAAELRRRRAEEDKRLAELDDKKAELEQMEANLQARIDAVHAEIADLEREEAGLTKLLQQQLAAEAEQASGGDGNTPIGPPPNVVSAKGLIWPVRGTLTSPFGPRWGRMHKGIDLSARTGTPIYAAQKGSVLRAGWGGGYGNHVVLDHGGGFATLYGHMSKIAVGSGESVSRGDVIGFVGSTGHSTGPHLHFETRVNGVAYNPIAYLP